MRMHIRRAAVLITAALIGSSGCQFLPSGPTGPSQAPNSSNAQSSQSMFPAMSQAPIDGSGSGTSLELPKQKKIDACLATAQLMEKSGKISEAIIYYEQIRQLDPRRDLACARHLAMLYDRKGDFDKALDEYNKLLAANPKDADAHNDLGYGYYTRGKFEAAEKSLRKAVECDPKSKRAWANLGMALAQLGQYPESLAAFEKSVNKAQGLCNIGFIQAAQGRWMEARDSYAMALKYEPGLQKAQAALERMDEGPKSKKDRERQDVRRRSRELERPPEVNPSVARGLPLNDSTGSIGAGSGMIVSSVEQPFHVNMPSGFQSPRSANIAPPPPLPSAPPQPLADEISIPAVPLPTFLPAAPSPGSLSID
jgi:Flp pilus assembly protein TadD